MKRFLSIMFVCCTLIVSAQEINIIPQPFEVKQPEKGTYTLKQKITWSSNFPAGDGTNARLEIFVPLVGQKEEYPTLLRGGSPIAGGAHVAQADREHSEQQMDHLDDPVIVADQQ